MKFDLSRRRLLAAIGIASVPATATVVVPAALPRLTPETYLAEMHAIGWRAYAGVLRGKFLGGVIERGPANHIDMFNSWDDFRGIQKRVPVNDPTFWPRTAQMLFDLGLHEDVSVPSAP